MKRICLFAGYNYKNKISQYVVDYLQELSQYCDIYYLADGSVNLEELDKINPYVKGAWVENHKKYDFGSWSILAKKYVGWETIDNYDELILANDSCFCVNSFKPVFEKMDKKSELDFWGLMASDVDNVTEFSNFEDYIKKSKSGFHIGSYFISIRKSFFNKNIFKIFLSNVKVSENRNIVSELYEFELNIGVFYEKVWRYSTIYMRDAFNLIKEGFPLLKVRIFTDNIGGEKLMDELAKVTIPFCDVDYSKYIKDIRSERKYNKKLVNRNSKFRKFYLNLKEYKHYVVPEFILLLFRYRTYTNLFSKETRKKLSNLIFPPILHDLYNNIVHSYNRQWNKKNDFRLTLKLRPKYGGYYPEHLKNYKKIHKKRALLLKDSKQMVIFFNIMRDFISGGMLSIDRFIEHSLPIAKENHFDIVLSGLPLRNACIYNDFFDYSLDPVDFKYLSKYTKPDKLLINIPEVFVDYFLNEITEQEYLWLFSIKDLRINILNQNDELMPNKKSIEALRTLCNNKLTITAAHKRYCTKEKSEQYKCPMYLLTPFLPDFYKTPVENKEKIIVLSPDKHEFKNILIEQIKTNLPDYKIITVNKMTLEEYKQLITKAMFTVTFGEGYDGYFIEPYLSDSIAFCVLNETFFPKDFVPLATTYKSWSSLLNNIIQDIRQYENNHSLYKEIVFKGEREIRKFTNNSQSNEDLSEYYKRFMSN